MLVMEKKPRKKSYNKPSVQSEKIFEQNALACGKTLARRTARCRILPRIS